MRTELRIGNIVKVYLGVSDYGPQYMNLKVKAIGDGCLLEIPGTTITKPFNDLEGISITENILLSAGFELRSGNKFLKKGMIGFLILHYDGLCIWEVGDIVLKYVHELQNLWFIINKEEIKIQIQL